MSAKPIRILHVVGGMNRGGIETWLMHVLRQTDRERFRMDFVAHTHQPCAYDDELRSLGSTLFNLVPPRACQFGNCGDDLRTLIARHGPYDVVHSHVHYYGGNVLRLARKAGVRSRIAHSHVDSSPAEAKAGLLRRGYVGVSRYWIGRHATVGLAASALAAADLFGPKWQADPRWRVLHYGVDLNRFQAEEPPEAVRAELQLPHDAFVIGHVGRFAEQKNHGFLVDVAAEVARRHEKAHLLLVGDGELVPAVKQKVGAAGLADRVTFAGSRADVPRLMMHAMDVLVLPSFYEGLPVVGIEAQAAGLPLVASDAVTPEVVGVPHLVRRLPLSETASAWAEAVLATHNGSRRDARRDALTRLEQSSFDIRNSVRELERVYVAEALRS